MKPNSLRPPPSPAHLIPKRENTSLSDPQWTLKVSYDRPFCQGDRILPFQLPHVILPSPRGRCSDDIDHPFYQSACRTYADKQRNGLQEEHTDSASISEHVSVALAAPFFPSLETPLPESAKEDLHFANAPPKNGVLGYWDIQLALMSQLERGTLSTIQERHKLSPQELLPRRVSSAYPR